MRSRKVIAALKLQFRTNTVLASWFGQHMGLTPRNADLDWPVVLDEPDQDGRGELVARS